MKGSTEKPFATVRNITISNLNIKCKSFGVMQGNPLDTVSSFIFKNITATSENPALKTKYKGVKAEKVTVNGKPLVIQ
jgi:hypothetical protein